MRWCTKSNLETNKCDEMKDPMERLASDNSMNITFTCVQGTSAANCMEKIKNGQADLITLDGGEINTAGNLKQFILLLNCAEYCQILKPGNIPQDCMSRTILLLFKIFVLITKDYKAVLLQKSCMESYKISHRVIR